MPVLAAGGTFATMTLAGLVLGILVGDRLKAPVLTVAGLFLGLALGGFSAYRLLLRSM
jgi:hypothetical protein